MPEPKESGPEILNGRSKHRSIVERIIVKATLVLDTPASFGNGDADAFTDIPLMEDEKDGSPLLTGTSITGALRNYLRERELGYGRAEGDEGESKVTENGRRKPLSVNLFGGAADDEMQSPLIVHDAPGRSDNFELRDGVKIDGKTRTAEEDKKFDFELLAAGARFDLRFELLISEKDNRNQLVQAFATALDGLAANKKGRAKGEITLGARKRRGFGRCYVSEWEVMRYNMKDRTQLLAWLIEGRTLEGDKWVEAVKPNKSASIIEALGGGIQLMEEDKRQRFNLKADFSVDGSLLIRSGFGEADAGADMVHLHSYRGDRRQPVIPGTSWTGAIRSRATQIANTLAGDRKLVPVFIEGMFGDDVESKRRRQAVPQIKREPIRGSRVEIAESIINGGKSLRQSRVKIDRFTGGAFESALFDEEPLFGNNNATVTLDLRLRLHEIIEEKHQQAEIGLLLLVLKDLWTGDLALGGEIGVGRGRFKGQRADIFWQGKKWTLTRSANDGLSIDGGKEQLEQCIKALREVLNA